jgi:hypothetical protein
MKKVLVIAVALTLVLSAVALAANSSAQVAVHVRAHNAKAGCTVGPFTACTDITTTLAAPSVDAFMVFYNLEEWKGVAFGFCWDATISSGTWNGCADLEIPSWSGPYMASGSGMASTWYVCHNEYAAVPGFVWVYVYGPGMMCPCDHPDPLIENGIQILDCNQNLTYPECTRCAGLGGLVGDDPCEVTGTAPSTWSEIKGLFE